MLFNLGYVVGNVVNQTQPESFCWLLENLLKTLADPVGDGLTIGKGELYSELFAGQERFTR